MNPLASKNLMKLSLWDTCDKFESNLLKNLLQLYFTEMNDEP